MICKVCDINNPEDSKFCIECGASTNNGKEPERIVSAEEMKQLLWSIDWEKMTEAKKEKTMREIEMMFKIWKADPSYIPIITAPQKTGGFIQAPKNADMKEFKNEWEELKRDMGIDAIIDSDVPPLSTIKSDDISSGGGLNNEGLLQKYTVEERLKKNYYDATRDNIPCGVCGDMRCSINHIPPIQLQYQEAFENIQYLRHRRYLKYGLSHYRRDLDPFELRQYGLRGDVKEFLVKPSITGTDVRKGILPQRPEPELTGIRK